MNREVPRSTLFRKVEGCMCCFFYMSFFAKFANLSKNQIGRLAPKSSSVFIQVFGALGKLHK